MLNRLYLQHRCCWNLRVKDSNYILYSYKDNNDGKLYEGFIAKLNNNGDSILWEKWFGGKDKDWFSHMRELEDEGFIAVGVTKNAQQNPGNTNGWLVRLSPEGDSLWARTFRTDTVTGNYFYGVQPTSDSGFIICGTAWDSTQDAWLVKTNCLGFDGPPQADFSYSPDSSGEDFKTTLFANLSGNSDTVFKWYFGDGDSSTEVNPTHTYKDSGTYQVTLIATACGEFDTITKTVTTLPPSGIDNSVQEQIRVEIYPNPFSNRAFIRVSHPELVSGSVFTLLNILGSPVYVKTLNGQHSRNNQFEFTIHKNNLPAGLYFYKLDTSKGVLKTGKLVIE